MSTNLLWRYAGSKATLAKWHVSLFPPDARIHVSVFGGTGAEFLYRRPSGLEVLNDLDKDIHDAYRVIRDPKMCRELVRLLEATPDGRRQFGECKAALDAPDPVRRAWAFLTLANTGARMSEVRNRSWLNPRASFYYLPRHLDWWRDRLRRVKLECRPWQMVVDQYDRDGGFLYLDPPYHPGTLRTAGKLYRYMMKAKDHVNLLLRLKKCRAKVLVCGYPHPDYDWLLRDWHRREMATRCRMGKERGPRTEVVWCNYHLPEAEKEAA